MPASKKPPAIKTDALIIGAGPCGLFQVFELGLQGIDCHIIDALDEPGGQCAALYPTKPIFDIPAIPECGASELTQRLLEQIKPFNYEMHLGQTAASLRVLKSGIKVVKTAEGKEFRAKNLVIAAGVGSFQPVPLKLDGIDAFLDTQVSYRVTDLEAYRGKDVVVLGGGDSALDWTLELVKVARDVTLVHRSKTFRAAPARVEEMLALHEQGRMTFLEGRASGFCAVGKTLTELEITGSDGETRMLPVDRLLVLFGLSPKLGPIAEWGLEMAHMQIEVDTERFQTAIPGIYAVGDVSHYPGKRKLILSGFHEAALAAFSIKESLNPGQKVHLMYTTTSPELHKRLGVKVNG